MHKKPKLASSVASRVSRLMCLHIDPKKFPHITEAHKHALHAAKHEIAASLHKVYMSMPQEDADPILEHFFNFKK